MHPTTSAEWNMCKLDMLQNVMYSNSMTIQAFSLDTGYTPLPINILMNLIIENAFDAFISVLALYLAAAIVIHSPRETIKQTMSYYFSELSYLFMLILGAAYLWLLPWYIKTISITISIIILVMMEMARNLARKIDDKKGIIIHAPLENFILANAIVLTGLFYQILIVYGAISYLYIWPICLINIVPTAMTINLVFVLVRRRKRLISFVRTGTQNNFLSN